MGNNPHILAIPYPAQGHVMSLMELSHNLAKHGFKITFVNTEFNHKRVIYAATSTMVDEADGLIHLVSIPDGMEVGDDRNHIGKLTDAFTGIMPGELKAIIQKINRLNDDKITCVIADTGMGWALEVAAELGILGLGFCPMAALMFDLVISIKKLIDDQVIDENGTPIDKEKMIQLSPNTPAMHPKYIPWACLGDFTTQKIIFDYSQKNYKALAENAEWIICNTTYDLEPETVNLVPKILPIGPLSATNNQLGDLAGSFLPEDAICLKWLDQQPPGSVIYVAFGSFTVFDPIQFQELALGLELSNRPFLWIVRPDLIEGNESDELYPEGFKERVASRGKMVGWAPQRAVLAHSSIACFLSHCGWNSTIEGVSNGVPFLCWPYFADQFVNESFICEIWKTGLNFERDEGGIITREEIRSKVEQLLGDESLREQALKMKEVVMTSINDSGSSNRNFKNLIKWLKP